MTNNDIIRRLRYTFDFSDQKMTEIFVLAEYPVPFSQINRWMKKEDDDEYEVMDDLPLAAFLNGFINLKRGKRAGAQPTPEEFLNNNIILRKLKIALNLKDDGMINIFNKVNVSISKHELSAFFRNPKQSQYRVCQGQYLRNFLHGMQLTYKGKGSHKE